MMRRRRQNLKEREEKKSNGGGGKRDITRVIRGLRRPSVRKEKERNIEGGWKRGAEKQTIATPASTLLPHQRLFAATRKPKKGSASSRCNKGGGMKRGGGGRKTTEGIDSGDEGAHEESMIDGVRTNEIPQDDPAHVPIFRMGEKPPLVRETLLRRGWTEWSEDVHEEMEWTLYWRSGGIKPSYIRTSNGQQRINHYLKSGVITRKDQLQRVLRKLKGVYGSVYNFVPTSYILPGEYTKFVKEYALQEKPTLWICKPTNASRGRDIFLIRDLGDLKYDRSMIVQRYIVNPLLVGGYKVDLRIYVLVVSYAPLEVYIYRDGLARFGTSKYDGGDVLKSDLTNLYAHLTNTSINKFSPDLSTDKDTIGAGCKWDFVQLRQYLTQQGHDWELVWKRISNIIHLTLLASLPVVQHYSSSFELFGFDIMLDDTLRPWLIEVNGSPALGIDCETDRRVKPPLISDMLDVLNLQGKEIEESNGSFSTRGSRYSDVYEQFIYDDIEGREREKDREKEIERDMKRGRVCGRRGGERGRGIDVGGGNKNLKEKRERRVDRGGNKVKVEGKEGGRKEERMERSKKEREGDGKKRDASEEGGERERKEKEERKNTGPPKMIGNFELTFPFSAEVAHAAMYLGKENYSVGLSHASLCSRRLTRQSGKVPSLSSSLSSMSLSSGGGRSNDRERRGMRGGGGSRKRRIPPTRLQTQQESMKMIVKSIASIDREMKQTWMKQRASRLLKSKEREQAVV